MAAKKPATRKKAEAAVAELPDGDDSRLTAAERAKRDLDIFRANMRGLQPPLLALTYDLSLSQIKRVIAQQKEVARLAAHESDAPLEIIQDELWKVDAIVEELAQVAASAKTTSGRTAAIMGKLAALKDRRAMLQATGILPENLGELHVHLDVERVGRVIIQIFEQHKIPEEAREQVRSVLSTGRELPPPPA